MPAAYGAIPTSASPRLPIGGNDTISRTDSEAGFIFGPSAPTWKSSLRFIFLSNWINVLLVFVPLGIVSGLLGWSDLWTFTFNFFALLPMAKLLGVATEEVWFESWTLCLILDAKRKYSAFSPTARSAHQSDSRWASKRHVRQCCGVDRRFNCVAKRTYQSRASIITWKHSEQPIACTGCKLLSRRALLQGSKVQRDSRTNQCQLAIYVSWIADRTPNGHSLMGCPLFRTVMAFVIPAAFSFTVPEDSQKLLLELSRGTAVCCKYTKTRRSTKA